MDNEHWFDALNKDLVRATPRRTLVGAAGALLAGLALGSGPVAEAAKKRKKKKKKKSKRRPQQCGPDDLADCEGSYELADDVKDCKDECARCKAAGLAFCSYHIPDDEHPDFHPTCCSRGEACCDFECCAPDKCCDEGAVGGERVCCDPDATCCPGQGCFTCDAPYVPNPDSCQCECPVECIDPFVLNRDTCECECPAGQIECDDTCVPGPVCPDDGCGVQGCLNPNRPDCCDGFCVNTQTSPSNCGGCGNRCEINEACGNGDCRCIQECCNSNSSGICVTPPTCCPEPCSLCVVGECLRWRNGIAGGYCEELANSCQVVNEYCPISFNGVHEGYFDCCGPGEICTDAGCTSAP